MVSLVTPVRSSLAGRSLNIASPSSSVSRPSSPLTSRGLLAMPAAPGRTLATVGAAADGEPAPDGVFSLLSLSLPQATASTAITATRPSIRAGLHRCRNTNLLLRCAPPHGAREALPLRTDAAPQPGAPVCPTLRTGCRRRLSGAMRRGGKALPHIRRLYSRRRQQSLAARSALCMTRATVAWIRRRRAPREHARIAPRYRDP